MAGEAGKLFVSIEGRLDRLKADLVKAETMLAASTGRMRSKSVVPLMVGGDASGGGGGRGGSRGMSVWERTSARVVTRLAGLGVAFHLLKDASDAFAEEMRRQRGGARAFGLAMKSAGEALAESVDRGPLGIITNPAKAGIDWIRQRMGLKPIYSPDPEAEKSQRSDIARKNVQSIEKELERRRKLASIRGETARLEEEYNHKLEDEIKRMTDAQAPARNKTEEAANAAALALVKRTIAAERSKAIRGIEAGLTRTDEQSTFAGTFKAARSFIGGGKVPSGMVSTEKEQKEHTKQLKEAVRHLKKLATAPQVGFQ